MFSDWLKLVQEYADDEPSEQEFAQAVEKFIEADKDTRKFCQKELPIASPLGMLAVRGFYQYAKVAELDDNILEVTIAEAFVSTLQVWCFG
jgi:hypothetical protein